MNKIFDFLKAINPDYRTNTEVLFGETVLHPMFPLTAIVSLKNDSTALVDAKGSQAPFAVFSLLSFSFLYLNLSSYTLTK